MKLLPPSGVPTSDDSLCSVATLIALFGCTHSAQQAAGELPIAPCRSASRATLATHLPVAASSFRIRRWNFMPSCGLYSQHPRRSLATSEAGRGTGCARRAGVAGAGAGAQAECASRKRRSFEQPTRWRGTRQLCALHRRAQRCNRHPTRALD